MISAVFFPADHLPEDFDLMAIAFQAERAGLKLFYNGRQHALLPKAFGSYELVEDEAASPTPLQEAQCTAH